MGETSKRPTLYLTQRTEAEFENGGTSQKARTQFRGTRVHVRLVAIFKIETPKNTRLAITVRVHHVTHDYTMSHHAGA